VDVEIGVNAQMPATLGLMQAAAMIMRIRDQAVDPGHGFEESENRGAVQLHHQVAQPVAGNLGGLELEFEPLLIAVKIALAAAVGKLAEQSAQEIGGQEVVHRNVREGGGVAILVRQRGAGGAAFRLVEGDIAVALVRRKNRHDVRSPEMLLPRPAHSRAAHMLPNT
jgi:hypothetical protein